MTHVLIVDDQEQNFYMLQMLLQGHGYEVRSARNGIEALNLARRRAPDLLITDILMPGMDGFSLCHEWMADERLRHVPLVFYTATYTDPQDEAFALSLGAARFIVKPAEPEALVEILRQVLENYTAQRPAPLDEPSQTAEVYYQQYNQTLIRKLENKMAQLEAANRVLEHDITKRKRAEEEAVRAAREWQTTFDAANDAIWILDQEQHVLRSNKIAERFFQRPCSELIGQHCWEIVHGTVQPIPECPILQMRNSLHRETLELQIGEGWFQITVDPILDAAGQYDGAVHIVSDITERRQFEETLAKERNLMRTLIDNLPDLIFVKDLESRFVLVNQASLQTGQQTMAEIIGKNDFEINPPELAAQYYADDQAVIHSGQPIIDREERNISVGQTRWFSTTKVPLRDSEGQIVGLIGMSRDITERKQAEVQLAEQLDELRRWHTVTLDREGRILDLKREVNELLRRLDEPARYPSADIEDPKGLGDPLGSL